MLAVSKNTIVGVQKMFPIDSEHKGSAHYKQNPQRKNSETERTNFKKREDE
jgi:hypothetical protein